EALIVRPAIQDAVDEYGTADDRGRERVAGEERDERRRGERGATEEARVEERLRSPKPADDRQDRRHDGDRGQRQSDLERIGPAEVGDADQGRRPERRREGDAPDDGSD